MLWGLRQLKLLSPRELLSGATEPQLTLARQRRRGRRSLWTGLLLVDVRPLDAGPRDDRARFARRGVRRLELERGAVLRRRDRPARGRSLAARRGFGRRSVGGRPRSRSRRRGPTGFRNTARHRQRSTTSVSLIAAATFVIVAVAAGRRNPAVETPDLHSGNGGFRLVAESTEPILYDLNTPSGRDHLDMHVPARLPRRSPCLRSQNTSRSA